MDQENHDKPELADRPSRSEKRREALGVLELAGQLVDLPPKRLQGIDLPDALREEIGNVRRVTAHGARKRQLAYLAKLLRRLPEEELAPARAALGEDRQHQLRETAARQRVEVLAERLVAEGDSALAELIENHPDANRQNLRTLVRNARRARQSGKPGHAMRDLIRALAAMELEN